MAASKVVTYQDSEKWTQKVHQDLDRADKVYENANVSKISLDKLYEYAENIWEECMLANFQITKKNGESYLDPEFLELKNKIMHLNPNSVFGIQSRKIIFRGRIPSAEGACDDCGEFGFKFAVPKSANFLTTGECDDKKYVCAAGCHYHCPECGERNLSPCLAGFQIGRAHV